MPSKLVLSRGSLILTLCSGAAMEPPSAQGAFARSGGYPLRRNISHCVGGRYPAFIALTRPCARPKPSRRLRFPYTAGLCRLLPVPAGSWPFPTLSPQSLYRCLDPYPAALLRCLCPFLPAGLRPHPRTEEFGAQDFRRYAISTASSFRGCSHSFMFRLPYLLGPPIAPTAVEYLQGGRAFYTTQ